MATELQNGHAESNGELSNAQRLMQQHEADIDHKVSVEEVPDEDDLKHGEPPVSASVLEAADGSEEIPVILPAKPKAAPLDTKSRSCSPSLVPPSHRLAAMPYRYGVQRNLAQPMASMDLLANLLTLDRQFPLSPTEVLG